MVKISKSHHVTKDGLMKKNPKKANSSSKKETYQGHWIDNDGKALSFNLYGEDEIDFDDTKRSFMDNMNEKHFSNLRKNFHQAGLKLHGFKWFSPKFYNYQGDSIDVVVSVNDRKRLISFISNYSNDIQKMLNGNSSYDGYMALTATTVTEIIENIESNFDVDIMVINFLTLNYPLDWNEDFGDLLSYEPDEDED